MLRDDDRESIEYLNRALSLTFDPDAPLESILRACSHAATLKNSQQATDYFGKQINGFLDDSEVTKCRYVRGKIVWVSQRGMAPNLHYDFAGIEATQSFPRPDCFLKITANLGWIRSAATSGWYRPAIEVKPLQVALKSAGFTTVYPVETYEAPAFQYCLEAIKQEAFEWASKHISYMKYGSRITDIWQRHRSVVDVKVSEIGLTSNFASIDRLLGSDNSQDWRGAMYACRSLLDDLADYLWKDPRDTYPPLQRKDDDGKIVEMVVKQDRPINRLMAYMNEKSDNTEQTKLTSNQLSYLGDILFIVNKMTNCAHDNVSQDLAETTAIHTYMLISDMIRLTDMEPVEQAVKYTKNSG